MKFTSCAVAMAVLAVAVGSVIVHGVWAQSLEPTTNPQPRLEPNASLAPPPVIEQRRIRYESFIDENGQPQTRGVWEIVPVSVSQPADSETVELAAAEVQAAKEAQELVHELQSVVLEGPKTELKAKLRIALAKQFEAQQKQRTREIASIEERLNKLKETLQKRDAAKDKIVDRRLDQLTGVRDELAWEETQGVGSASHRDWAFPVNPSGVLPQPAGVPGFGGPQTGNTYPAPSYSRPRTPALPPPLETPSTGTIPKTTFPRAPAPAAPPVPPAPAARVIPLGVPDGGSVHLGGNPPTPPARVIPSSGVPGTTPAPPVAPPAPPAPAAPATLLPDSTTGVKFRVKGAAERLEMTVNTSRVVEFPFDVPRMLVNNPDLARVVPISPRSIQVAAVRAGVTQLNAWDANDNVTTVDLTVLGDDT